MQGQWISYCSCSIFSLVGDLDLRDWKTFRELENKYHISRQALEQRIAKISGFSKYQKKYKHRWYISPQGVKLLNPQEKHNSTARVKHTRRGVHNSGFTKPELVELIKSQQRTISRLANVNSRLQRESSHKSKLLEQKNNHNQKTIKQINSHNWLWRLFH